MTKRLAIIMDELQSINPHNDSTIAMIQQAALQNIDCFITTQNCLSAQNNQVVGQFRHTNIDITHTNWYQQSDAQVIALNAFDAVLMRTDPPVDANYLATTQLLSLAQSQGAKVYNNPQSLRDYNEKLFILEFNPCIPTTIVSASLHTIKAFVKQHKKVVLKRLDSLAGRGVFLLQADDDDLDKTILELSAQQTRLVMLQRYLPEIKDGDKRVILIDGEAIPYVLVRIPKQGDFRGNLAQGASFKVRTINDVEMQLCQAIAPTLKKRGLYFVGLDIIGDKITEINVTSPTGIRQIENATDVNIAKQFLQGIM